MMTCNFMSKFSSPERAVTGRNYRCRGACRCVSIRVSTCILLTFLTTSTQVHAINWLSTYCFNYYTQLNQIDHTQVNHIVTIRVHLHSCIYRYTKHRKTLHFVHLTLDLPEQDAMRQRFWVSPKSGQWPIPPSLTDSSGRGTVAFERFGGINYSFDNLGRLTRDEEAPIISFPCFKRESAISEWNCNKFIEASSFKSRQWRLHRSHPFTTQR